MSGKKYNLFIGRRVIRGALVASALWLTATPYSQTADSLQLSQVIQDVIRHNDRLAAARFMEEAAKAKIGPAGAWDDPMLMLGVQNLPTNFDFEMDPMTMKMVGLSQNLPYSGYKGLAGKAAESQAQASAEERRGTELNLVTAAKWAYFDLYYRQLNLQDLERQLELQEQVVASSTAKLKANQAGQEEVLAAQAALWRLESTILSSEQELTASANRLYSLRGLAPPASIPMVASPGPTEIPDTVNAWLDGARQVYPPLQRLQRQAESYAFAARSSRRMRWPMLDLSASYGFRSGTGITGDGMAVKRDNMISFGASLSLPIFSGRQQGQMARSMTAMEKSADAEAAQLWREVESELNTLYQRALRLKQSLALYQERIVPATEDAFRTALTGYANNQTTFASLLMYASAVYRDRITANEIANELDRTLAEVEQYTTDARAWESLLTGAGE